MARMPIKIAIIEPDFPYPEIFHALKGTWVLSEHKNLPIYPKGNLHKEYEQNGSRTFYSMPIQDRTKSSTISN